MTAWFHTAILATSIAATVAIGLASAAIYEGMSMPVAPKSDRLSLAPDAHSNFVTVETRGPGVSVLNRLPVANASN